jgi:TonB family protein
MLGLLVASNLVSILLNDSFEVESCEGVPFSVVKTVAAKYPTGTYAVKGFTEFKVNVNADGIVSSYEIVDSVPYRVFDRAAKRALNNWQFSSSELDERCFNVIFKFKLSE